jgi:hypothetical protein
MIRLSSPFTFLMKFIVPAIFIGVGLYGLIATLVQAFFLQLAISDTIKPLLFLGFWLSFTLTLSDFTLFPMKKVSFDEDFLYVSNYLRKIRISLCCVEYVKETRFGNYIDVAITLKEESAFGRKIKFIPGFYYKNVVAVLQSAIEDNKLTRP